MASILSTFAAGLLLLLAVFGGLPGGSLGVTGALTLQLIAIAFVYLAIACDWARKAAP